MEWLLLFKRCRVLKSFIPSTFDKINQRAIMVFVESEYAKRLKTQSPSYRQIESLVRHRCWKCDFIGPSSLDPPHRQVCPKCGERGPWITHPLPGIRVIAGQCLQAQERGENELVVILFGTMFEVMLEDFFDLLMIRLGIPKDTRDYILQKKISGVKQRLDDLFPGLTGKKFKTITRDTEFADFYNRWEKIRSERNAFLHEEHGRISKKTAQEAIDLIEPCFRLFEWLNNSVIVEARHRRVD